MSAPQAGAARQRTEILISGFGGQGVVRMGQIIGLYAIHQGQRVTILKSHGTETRGGYVRSQIVISPDYVDSPVVENADIFVAFSEPAYRKFFELAGGLILFDPDLVTKVNAAGAERHVPVPSTALSKEHFSNPLFANMIMLGALTRTAQMDLAAMRKTMLEVIPRFHDDNSRALELGYNLECAVNAVGTAHAALPAIGAAHAALPATGLPGTALPGTALPALQQGGHAQGKR
jgi:2-oxoglutarate ferredoxin oxidoreductase subunit gamma